jgi:hypothetical protein
MARSRKTQHRPSPPVRYWRWLWLSCVVKALAVYPAFIVLILPYLAAKALVAVCDWWGGKVGQLTVWCLNRDRQRAQGARFSSGAPR